MKLRSEVLNILNDIHKEINKIRGNTIALVYGIRVLETEVIQTHENGDREENTLLEVRAVTSSYHTGSYLVRTRNKFSSRVTTEDVFKRYQESLATVTNRRDALFLYSGDEYLGVTGTDLEGKEVTFSLAFSAKAFYTHLYLSARSFSNKDEENLPILNDKFLPNKMYYYKDRLCLKKGDAVQSVKIGEATYSILNIEESGVYYKMGITYVTFRYQRKDSLEEETKKIVVPYIVTDTLEEIFYKKYQWENTIWNYINAV